MESSALLSVMSATVINAALPGPCLVLIATRAALSGRQAGLRVSLGVAAAQLTYVVVVLCLLAMAWGVSETAHMALRVVGTAILVVLAIRMLRQAAVAGSKQSVAPPGPGATFLSVSASACPARSI